MKSGRLDLNQRPLRPERAGADSQGVGSKQLTTSQNSACPQSCPDCRQAETIQDNSGRDSDVVLRSLLRVVQDGDDGNGTKGQPGSQTSGEEKGTGKALLKVIRLLVEMAPEERTALIELLKAVG